METLLHEWCVRATALLAVGWLASLAMRRGPAARRASTWRLVVLGTIALPLLALCGPRIPLPYSLPAWLQAAGGDLATALPEVRYGSGASRTALAAASERMTDRQQGALIPDDEQNLLFAPSDSASPSVLGLGRRGLSLLNWPAWIWLWLVGVCLWVSRLVVRVHRAARVVRGASSIEERVDAAAVVTSDACGSPFVLDLRPLGRAAIVVPIDFREEPAATRAAILRHERAHVERWDGAFFLLASLLRSMLWFHPLVWLAERRLRAESERACDDAALESGIERADLAELLLRAASTGHAAPVPAMARVGSIEERIVALLDAGQARGLDGWRQRWGRGVAGVSLVLLAAALTPNLLEAAVQEAAPQEASGADTARQATPLETSLAFLLTLRDESSGAWRADAGYKLNDLWRVTHEDVPHVGVTALALEALVLGGQIKEETVLGSKVAIREAKEFLLAHQDSDGYFRSDGTRLRSHAYALAALSSLSEFESSPELMEAIQRGLRFSLEARAGDTPGWYFQPLTRKADLIESAFQMQAVEAAAEALEPADDAVALQLLIDALKAREAVSGLARTSYAEVGTLGAGYRRHLPAAGGRLYPPGYRATAAGLWLERNWLAGGAPELTQIASALAAFRSARTTDGRGLHFTVLDAEMILARLEYEPHGQRVFAYFGGDLAMNAVSIIASARAHDGQLWRGIGAGPSFTQAAGCLVLAQANADSRFLFSVTVVGDNGVETVREMAGNTTVFDVVLAARESGLLQEGITSMLLIRGGQSEDPLRLPVDLEAIMRGDTTTNYPVQAGDALEVSRRER